MPTHYNINTASAYSMLDLYDANTVQLEIDTNGRLWVYVDGVCVLRVRKIHNHIDLNGLIHHMKD